MEYVVDKIVEQILDNGPSANTETMVRVDGFDNIKIYEQVAAKISARLEAQGLTVDVKIAKNKWNSFKKKIENTAILQSMERRKWIAEDDSITYYRNLHTSDVVVLMGTEDEEDKGGLANCYSITPDSLIRSLKGKYHLVFRMTSFSDRNNAVVDRLYTDLFEYVAVDICKLSNIADSWKGKIENIKDFMELFFMELPQWGLPYRSLELPKISDIMGSKNILASSYRFIVRQPFNSKMTVAQYKKYIKRIDYYNSENAEFAKYPSDHQCWSEQGVRDYDEFSKILKEFIIGENIQENAEKLLDVDYCIIEDVLNIGIPTEKKPPKDKVITLVGEPLEIFTKALFITFAHIKEAGISVGEIKFKFSQAEIVCIQI